MLSALPQRLLHSLIDLRSVFTLAGAGQDAKTLAVNFGKIFSRFFSADGSQVSFPPHSLSIYRDYLSALKEYRKCRFFLLKEQLQGVQVSANQINVVLRHDLDAGNPDTAFALCNVEQELSVRSTVHILVDGELYNPSVFKELAPHLHKSGFDVGLHTQSWMKKDYIAAFHDEIHLFEDIYGFAPQTFTFHGAWPRTATDMERRKEMTLKIKEVIEGTSIIGYSQQYHWIGEDSNILGKPAPLRQKFFNLQKDCFLGGWALLLTHDNHWKQK